jgi:hypothetical protein
MNIYFSGARMNIHTKIKIIIIFFSITVISTESLYAVDDFIINKDINSEKTAAEPPLFMPFNAGVLFNTKDAMGYCGFGLFIIPEQMLSARGHFYYRFVDKTVFIEKTTNHYYQYRESRYGVDIVLDSVFRTSFSRENIFFPGFFIGAGAGITSGRYRGAKADAGNKGTLIVNTGLQIGRQYYCRIGYQYMKVPWTPSNHLIFELGLSF